MANSERRKDGSGFPVFRFTFDSELFHLREIFAAFLSLGFSETVPDNDHDHEDTQDSQHTVNVSFLDLLDMLIFALFRPNNTFDYVTIRLIRSMNNTIRSRKFFQRHSAVAFTVPGVTQECTRSHARRMSRDPLGAVSCRSRSTCGLRISHSSAASRAPDGTLESTRYRV